MNSPRSDLVANNESNESNACKEVSLITSAFKVGLAGGQMHVPWMVSHSDCQFWRWHLLCYSLWWSQKIRWGGLSSPWGVAVGLGLDLKLTEVLGGHQEPAGSLAVDFTGQQLCILSFCRGLRDSWGHDIVDTYWSMAEGSMNLDVPSCCPCHKLRRHSCLSQLHFLPFY